MQRNKTETIARVRTPVGQNNWESWEMRLVMHASKNGITAESLQPELNKRTIGTMVRKASEAGYPLKREKKALVE